ncbi:sister chromatid cohesion protein Eso1 [Lindgomyces ingoldianus]|uniref:Sister chromatid cohesion protein Eso1 n=1 Tax=Lindgomyces ingoldianus TaxID=673940 RepID=A0ACB6QT03_9PLEO|nr:sister chromatid cohesion protein Eso1 [Lindgomyces ingoldianus]KAF2469422.1 sister chromatid cohesion protein Eso1 [Lindgomyces ingoldianus]
MSSPAPFIHSPLSISSRRTPKSQFTYKQLHQLKSYSTTTPLRVIAHIDLDAFYAQCETVRLGLSPNLPLAVQQWQGLIAINYPARAYGLNRHITSTEALKLCPEVHLQHVATWKEGDEKWAYHPEAYKHIATHKVSLDPYRLESRRILKCIKEALPEKEQRVEKASIDEVFIDLSVQVHRILLERYPELRGLAPYDDPMERLPKPPTTVLNWEADTLIGMGEDGEGEEMDPDWDDVCMVIASEIVRDVRRAVAEELHYTCSSGIARNKMLAKLGSGYKKPNQQTVIRNRAAKHFLSEFKFTKIRMLGGKLGDEVVAMFSTDLVRDLLEQPLEQLKRLGDDTGSWLYSTIRGEDNSEVNPRTQIKSMLSAKSFRPAINSFEQGIRWLRIFVADIFSRCVEEGVLENKRRPKTINLHHRQGMQTRSRQSPIPQGKPLSEAMLFDLAKNLLAQVVVDGRAWPCANLSLSVGGFEDGVTNNRGIGLFLVRGEEAKAVLANERGGGLEARNSGPPPAKRRRRERENIQNFFRAREERNQKDFNVARAFLKASRETTRDEMEEEYQDDESDGFEHLPSELDFDSPDALSRPSTPPPHPHDPNGNRYDTGTPPSAQPNSHLDNPPPYQHYSDAPHKAPALHQQTIDTFFCSRCNIHLPSTEKSEHEDFHFAMDLSKEIREEERRQIPATWRRWGGKRKRREWNWIGSNEVDFILSSFQAFVVSPSLGISSSSSNLISFT